MFKITLGELRNVQFQRALAHMLQSNDYPSAKAAYRVAKLGKLFSEEGSTSDQVFVGLLEKEGIEIKPDGTYEVPEEKIDEWKAVYKDFCDTAVEVGEPKLGFDLLPNGLTPAQILALEPIIEP